jgi:crotonobetainyl-CoA:carnitine CoA-transferase CaiB-like acyl-CoA transferase
MTDGLEEATAQLEGTNVVTLAVNAPGPAAARRLRSLGASVVKVEPPGGDPLSRLCPAWYLALTKGQEVVTLDLKCQGDRSCLDSYLESADLLLTSSRPAALARLGLDPASVSSVYPELCRVEIIGYPPPKENEPGHDLTYLAGLGLLSPPELPRTLLADLAAAERTVSAALALLLARDRGRGAGHSRVSIAEAAAAFAEPPRYGLTKTGATLGGGLPGYNVYPARGGWIAVAALEPHFWSKLLKELGLKEDADAEDLGRAFLGRTAEHWQAWAEERDLPVAALDYPYQ